MSSRLTDFSRSIEDVRMIKSASTTTFDTGEGVTYTLQVDVSEYIDTYGIQLGDLIPNGLCPIDATTNYVPDDSVCDPGAGPTVVVTDALGVVERLRLSRTPMSHRSAAAPST